jgi:hypothetical protein
MRVAWWSLTAFALGLLAAPAPVAADCDDPFGDPDDILALHLQMSRADWSGIRFDDQVGNGCDAQFPYFEVEFRCGDDEPWIDIGARRKRGDQRGRDTDEKPPIKLDFNRVLMGQRWPAARGNLGFRKLSLNNGQEDNPGGQLTALLTEHYSWRLMRAEVPAASGVAYARIYVHFTDDDEVEYHGLYILIEDIDRTAIRARFGADDGTLLKTTTGSCRNRTVFDDMAPNSSTDAFDAWDALSPGDFPGTWYDQTDEAIVLDELLRAEALRDVLANGADTVLGNNYSNFYSWDSKTSARRHYLPWDLDDVFRPFPQQVPFDRALETNCSVIGDPTRCETEVGQRYLEIACQLTQGTLAPERLLADFAALDAVLRPIIAEEIPLVWPDDDPLDPNTAGTYANEYDRMVTWISERIPDVRAQIEARGVTCAESCQSGLSEPCEFLHCEGVRSCDSGRWTTCIVDPDLEQDNGTDDDCDGLVDEGFSPDAGPGGGGGSDGGPGDDVAGGCTCQGSDATGSWLLFVAIAFVTRRRWRTGYSRRHGEAIAS